MFTCRMVNEVYRRPIMIQLALRFLRFASIPRVNIVIRETGIHMLLTVIDARVY
ncbi:hypothetical protein J2Z84_002105 [Agrobacterium rubi]|nr:hypothetical protein [Agrobacterium rubi]